MSDNTTKLRKWLDGDTTPEEAEKIKEDLAATPAASLARQLDQDWDRIGDHPNPDSSMHATDTERLMSKVRTSIHPAKHAPVISMSGTRRLIAAASVLVIAVAAASLYQSLRSRPSQPALAWRTIRNPTDHKMKVELPDHSLVYLEAHSRLDIAADYGKADRHVQLTGEAFFKIAPDAKHHFTVEAAGVKTHVLGTDFNIEAYEGEPATRVSLLSGKVQTTFTGSNHLSETVTLSPGQQLVYDHQEAKALTGSINPDESPYTGNSLILQNISLSTALHRVGAHYGKTILLSNSLSGGNQRLSAIVPGDNLTEALDNITFIYRLHYRIEKDTIYLYKN